MRDTVTSTGSCSPDETTGTDGPGDPMILINAENGDQPVDFSQDGFAEAVGRALSTLPPASIVGLIAPTGPRLLKAWHGCIAAGHLPVVLQQPTQKLSRLYWSQEIEQSVRTLGVALLLCQNRACAPEGGPPTVLLEDLPAPSPGGGGDLTCDRHARLLQLSSGTTGHRKGVSFSFGDVARHVADYNRVLGLTQDDCIVSWLPLYHDMGFIAAFLTSQIVGCRLVLIDPMRWVQQPELLCDVIERHDGTTCFMPNFAFELMTQRGRLRRLPTMRRWISCSEPSRVATLTRFADAAATPAERIVNCYGMAENIFAVAQGGGLKTQTIDGQPVVSCGRPIPGVEVKLVDGELFIRSAYSMQAYSGGERITDEAGFYGSGDLGEIVDGEIYLTGRKRDVVIHAGQKFLLSDVDHKLDAHAQSGRIASFGIADPALGTDTIACLIEDETFWTKDQDLDSKAAIAREIGVETARVHYVPPRFITKTSSGKVNRVKTAGHWARHLAERDSRRDDQALSARERAEFELRNYFPGLDFGKPIGAQLDSLGALNLALILSRHDPEFHLDPERSVDSYLAPDEATGADDLVIRVVSLCDYEMFGPLLEPIFEGIKRHYRLPIQIRHICVPPAKAILSDLIFTDYFMSRDERFPTEAARIDAYAPLLNVQRHLREASVILVDDMVNLRWPSDAIKCPIINHDFRAGEGAELLAVRWQRYARNHHLLACDVLDAEQLPRAELNETLARLGEYLGVPLVRISFDIESADVCGDWEVRLPWHVGSRDYFKDDLWISYFLVQFYAALDRALERAPLRPGRLVSFIDNTDPAHWCGWQINPKLIDFILDRYDRLLVLGVEASVPYLFNEAQRRGKRVTYRSDFRTDGDYDCVVQLGLWGRPHTDKPLYVVMADQWTNETAHNVPDAVRIACPPRLLHPDGIPAVYRWSGLYATHRGAEPVVPDTAGAEQRSMSRDVVADPGELGIDRDRLAALLQWADQDRAARGLPSCQIAVARHGRLAGVAALGAATTATRYQLFSACKPIVASAAWLLIGEGRLDPSARVIDYIPEFGANGKQAVTVEQVMTHSAGFPHAAMPDWDNFGARLKQFASWTLEWPPGSRFEYHPWSAYWVIADLIERLSGQGFREFIQDRVVGPLGLEDISFGTASGAPDIADMVFIHRPGTPDESGFFDTFNRPEQRAAGSPGSGGIGGAPALALFYQALLCNPGRLWKPDLLADLTGRIRNALPDQDGFPANRSLGLCIAGEGRSQLRRWFGDALPQRAFGKGGAAGAIAWADPDTGLSFAWLSNGVDSDALRQAPHAHELTARALSLVQG